MPPLDHQAGGGLTEVEAAGQVDVEVLLPLPQGNLQEGDAVADRRVADGDVQRLDRREGRVDGFPVADIGLDVGDVAVLARPLQPRLSLIGDLRSIKVTVEPSRRQLRPHRRADIARTTSDGDASPVQMIHELLHRACLHTSLKDGTDSKQGAPAPFY